MRLAAGIAVLVALFALACRLWRRGYRDVAAERARPRRGTLVIVHHMPSDPFYDDDGDGTGGAAA